MDLAINLDSGFALIILLGVVGAALVAAGAIAYRGTDRVWVKALAAGSMAAGVTVWAFILWITPVSVVSGG